MEASELSDEPYRDRIEMVLRRCFPMSPEAPIEAALEAISEIVLDVGMQWSASESGY